MKKSYFIKTMSIFTGLLILLFFVPKAHAQLYINEFMASNDSAVAGPQGDYPDWIEIYNAGDKDVCLAGYFMSDKLDKPSAMYKIPNTYPDSVTVPAHGYLVFYANKDENYSVLNLNFSLKGSGEAIGLWNSDSVFVDSLTYGQQTTDVSYGRYPDGSKKWYFMKTFTPGKANANPEKEKPKLFINEFMASNDSAVAGPQGDYPDWIEIYNAGDNAVDLSGYFMSDKLNKPSAMYKIPDTYPDSVTVPAHGYLVFYANKDENYSVRNLNFSLKGSGEAIGLWSPDSVFLDSLTYSQQKADTSYGRFPDGSSHWFFMPKFTPGKANANPNPEKQTLFINEFMASNDSAVAGPQGDYPDWIEIYNAGEKDVCLAGYFMSDKLKKPSAMYKIPNTYPDSVTVPAHGYLVFYANKDVGYSVLNLNFSLKGSGEAIGLWSPDSIFVDSLTYGPQTADVSYGRYPDGSDKWYAMTEFTPGKANKYVATAVEENRLNTIGLRNYPNPFNGFTTIEFTLPKAERVTIKVYSVTGTLVNILTDKNYPAGTHSVQWNGSSLPAGYYYYSLSTEEKRIVRKALIIK
jgi:hypothetical protein